MGFYNVAKPCVVGKLHYVRPTTAPIEVDDEVAAPLVESGELTVYEPFSGVVDLDGSVLGDVLGERLTDADAADESASEPVDGAERTDEAESEKPASRRRAGGRRGAED